MANFPSFTNDRNHTCKVKNYSRFYKLKNLKRKITLKRYKFDKYTVLFYKSLEC